MGKILVIDSKKEDREAINNFLVNDDFEKIIMADSGNKGLKEMYIERPDIIVIDSMIADIDCFELCRKIKENNESNIAKIIVITDNINEQTARKAIDVGVDDLCIRTMDFSVLSGVVKKFIKNIDRRNIDKNRLHSVLN